MMLRLPDTGGECLDAAETKMFVEPDSGAVDARDGERESFVVASAQRLDGAFHELASDAVSLMAGHHANLRGVTNSLRDGRSKDHADQRIAGCGAHEKRSFGEELSATRKEDDVAEEAHASGLGAVLVVDFTVDVIGVGELDQARSGFESAVGPWLDA